MISKWTILPLNESKKINFQWILIYQNLHNLVLQNTTGINNFFTFILKDKILSNNSFRNSLSQNFNVVYNKPVLNRTTNFKTYFKTPQFCNSNQPKIYTTNKTTFYNLFLIYIQYTTLNSHKFFVPHTNFKTLFLFSQHNTTCYLNLTKMYAKWNNTCNFIINLFFIKTNLIVFSVKTLKSEALSFNWSYNLLNYNLFKYSSPIFFTKDTNFGIVSTLVFKKFHQNGLNTVFLTDIKYHEKNLYYFKRFNITTIGLVPYNLNPWLVTYAIPTASNSLFIQYFFLKLLTYFRQYSLNYHYNNYRQLW